MLPDDQDHQERYRPGQLDLGLNAAKAGDTSIQTSIQTCDVILASYSEFQPFQNDLRKSPFRPTLCALKNLKGTLLYFQKKYHSAIDEFNAVLKMDEENLNARQNLYETYRELGCWTKAAEFENAENKINDQKLKARCQGEQAFSIMFDCHIAVNDSERYKRGLFLFQHCTNISFEDRKEDIQWTLWFLQLVLRSLNGASEPKKMIKESLKLLIKRVFLILKKAENRLLYSMALGILARFINSAACRFKKDFETFTELAIEDDIKDKVPELADIESWFEDKGRPCFQLAYKTYPYVESIVRFQRNLMMSGSKESLEEALDLYTKADGKLLDTLNKDWFAMSTLSDIYLKLFRVKCKMHDDRSRQEDTKDPKTEEMQNLQTSESAAHTKVTKIEGIRTLVVERRSKETKTRFIQDLDKCIEYGEIAEKLFQSSELFNNIAVSYHEKASCEEDKDKREEYFLKACSYFNHAIKHSDGKCPPFIHVGLGNCLFEMKEYRPAVESYTSAIECRTKNRDIYKFLMKAYIALLQEQGSQDPEAEKRLLNEICYWLKNYKQVKEDEDKKKTEKPTTDSVKSFILEDIRKDNESTDGDSSESRLVDSVYGRIVATYYEKVMGHKNDEDDDPEECLKHIISVSYLQERTFLSVTVLSEIIKSPNMYSKFMDFIISTINISSHHFEEAATVIADAFNIQQQSSNAKFDCDVNLLQLMRKLRANMSLTEHVSRVGSEKYKKLFAILRHECDEEHETAMPKDEEVETDLPEDDKNSIAGILVKLNRELKPRLRKQLSVLERRIISFHSHNAQCCYFVPAVSQSQRKEPRTRQTKYEYDFYVIASESDRDRDYVVNKLLPTLEISHGFKGCIDERDSRLGHYKVDEMMLNIKKSFRILIVISEDSEKNQLFKFKLQQAVNENMERKGEALIPLILEQMYHRLSGSVPDELTTLMSVKSSDLEKLVRALEDNS